MKESFEEFSRSIMNINGPRIHKVTNSYGVYDYFKFYRKNKPLDKKYVLTESQYFSIIRKVNEYLVKNLENDGITYLGGRLGTLEVRTFEIKPKIGEEGELIYNAPINWNATLKLWYEDEDAKSQKKLVKIISKEFCRFMYIRIKAYYKNKMYYDFAFNKELKIRVSNKIRNGKLQVYQTGKRLIKI